MIAFRRIFANWTVLVVSALICACGSLTTKEKGAKAEETDTGLTGKWSAGCAAADWLGLRYEITFLNFSVLGDYERTTTVYGNAGCVDTAAIASLFESGTYQTLGDSAVVGEAKDVNFTLSAAKVTPRNDQVATEMSQHDYCSVPDWRANEERDVLGRTCLGRSFANGSVTFDIYRLKDNGPLIFGRSSIWFDRSSADLRPQQLDESRTFVKR